nr:hypothetical protein [uncultured Cellulosilyticum sp.]
MKANALTLGGILVALSVVLLYLSTFIPTNTLVLLTLVSFMPPIALMEKGLKTALLVYICTTLSSLLFIPLNITLLYLLFFGIYGIIKGLIERINKPFLEIVLKLLFFNSIFLISVFLLSSLLGINVLNSLMTHLTYFKTKPLNSNTRFLILFGIVQPIFLIYDYALTLLVGHYDEIFTRHH